MSEDTGGQTRIALPRWAATLRDGLERRRANLWIVHGNTDDRLPLVDESGREHAALSLPEWLATAVLSHHDVVLAYDRGRGIDFLTPGDRERTTRMRRDLERALVAIDVALGTTWSKTRVRSAAEAFEIVDRYIAFKVSERFGEDSGPGRTTIVIKAAAALLPELDDDRRQPERLAALGRVLGWADDAVLTAAGVQVLLLTPFPAELAGEIRRHPSVASVEVPLPDLAERARRAAAVLASGPVAGLDDKTAAGATAGLRATDLERALTAAAAGVPLTQTRDEIVAARCSHLASLSTPHLSLDDLIAPRAVRERLEQDVELTRRGRTDVLPPAYLLCGPAGSGKRHAATCLAGSLERPALVLEAGPVWDTATTGGVARLLASAAAIAPAVVVIPAADRVLAADTPAGRELRAGVTALVDRAELRGRLLWLLLSDRPDRLPRSFLQPGRADVRVPLFPPDSHAERRALFARLARGRGVTVEETSLPALREGLSGAEIEALVVQCLRRAAIDGQTAPSSELIGDVQKRFATATDLLERELQQLAAVRAASDLRFLPERLRTHRADHDRELALDRRLAELRGLVDGTVPSKRP